MFVRRVYVPPEPPTELGGDQAARGRWPFTVPAVAQLEGEGLRFAAPVTFLVGDNGAGKSTLVEAIAEGFGLDSAGGRAGQPPPAAGRAADAPVR